MPLTGLVARLRTGSQGFNKEQQSSSGSSVSVQRETNGNAEYPNGHTVGSRDDATPSDEMYASVARLEPPKDSNAATNLSKKDPPLTLRKRFFSKTGGPKIPLPIRPMTSGNDAPMNDRLDILRPNSDMAALLRMIENM